MNDYEQSNSVPLLEQLIVALQCFPGVGPKSSQRMALHLLQRNHSQGLKLAELLQQALETIGQCEKCRAFTENDLCNICKSHTRDENKLCVVHSHYDMMAIEATGLFKGMYFVLHGVLSPIDGIDSKELAIDKLVEIVKTRQPQEVILATNSSPEGEMTAYYIKQYIGSFTPTISKLAQGIPLSSEVELLDANTLAMALNERKDFV